MQSLTHPQAYYRPDQQTDQLYEHLSDQELMARMSYGDEPALGVIYDRYHRLMYSIALRITGDRASAEEVVQDVCHVVWRSAGTFDAGRSFAAWLTGITRHRAIDATRTRNYRAREHDVSLDDSNLTAHTWHTDEQADAFMLREVIYAALAVLSHPQRQVIELAYYNDLTCGEIANKLGEPIGTVKSRMRLGLLRLRQALSS